MSTLRINETSLFATSATVRESDKYSNDVYVSFERKYHESDSADGCSEMFLTPSQLELLGLYLVRKAREIMVAQENR